MNEIMNTVKTYWDLIVTEAAKYFELALAWLMAPIFLIGTFEVTGWMIVAAAALVLIILIIIIACCAAGAKKRKAKAAAAAAAEEQVAEEPVEETPVEEPVEEAPVEEAPVEKDEEIPAEFVAPVVEEPNDELNEEAEEAQEAEPVEKKAPMKIYHISKRKTDGLWQVRASGAKKVLKLFATQAEAIAFARRVASNQNTSFVIHKEDGSFRKISYSNKKK